MQICPSHASAGQLSNHCPAKHHSTVTAAPPLTCPKLGPAPTAQTPHPIRISHASPSRNPVTCVKLDITSCVLHIGSQLCSRNPILHRYIPYHQTPTSEYHTSASPLSKKNSPYYYMRPLFPALQHLHLCRTRCKRAQSFPAADRVRLLGSHPTLRISMRTHPCMQQSHPSAAPQNLHLLLLHPTSPR